MKLVFFVSFSFGSRAHGIQPVGPVHVLSSEIHHYGVFRLTIFRGGITTACSALVSQVRNSRSVSAFKTMPETFRLHRSDICDMTNILFYRCSCHHSL